MHINQIQSVYLFSLKIGMIHWHSEHIVIAASDPAAGWGGGAKKHEIYMATFGGHLFMTYFYRAGGGHGPLGTPLDPLLYWSTDHHNALQLEFFSISLQYNNANIANFVC